MRFPFLEIVGDPPALARPAVPVIVEELEDRPQVCLVDTGTVNNRFAAWLADTVGIDLVGAPEDRVVVAGVFTTAKHARAALTIGGTRYDAPVTSCEPWPFAFHLLGLEGFFRFFRVTICAAESWLEIEREA